MSWISREYWKIFFNVFFFAITVEIFRTCDDYLILCTLRVTSSCIIKLVFIIWCLQFPLHSFIRRRNIYFSHVTIFSHQIYSYLQGDSIEKCHEQIKMPSLKPHFGLINMGSEMQSLGALIFFQFTLYKHRFLNQQLSIYLAHLWKKSKHMEQKNKTYSNTMCHFSVKKLFWRKKETNFCNL